MTTHTLAILAAMLTDPTKAWYGLELCEAAGLRSGTLYPTLARLERAGILDSTWENADPRTLGRPRRRLYEFTNAGRERAEMEIAHHLERLRVDRPSTSMPQRRPGPQAA